MFKTNPVTIPCVFQETPSPFQREIEHLRMSTSSLTAVHPGESVALDGKVKKLKKKSKDSIPRKDKVVIDVVGQYNNIIGKKDVHLPFRKLPPVKLSFQPSSKSKFVPSPHKSDLISRILKPQLGQSSSSAAHHIFTEGISRKSEVPNPPFSLPLLKVPYSNLPENISIFKEKDQFTFTVKNEEYMKSPYKLAPLDDETPETKDGVSEHLQKGDTGRTELKSSIVKLEPIASASEGTKSPSTSRLISPIKRSSPTSAMSPQIREAYSKNKRVSIVSIGDTVSESVDEMNKREMRKLYPMYDNHARKTDIYTRQRTRLSYDRKPRSPSKPKPNPTFTYRVSFASFMGYIDNDQSSKLKPIKNNLREGRSGRYRGDNRLYTSESEFAMYSELSNHRAGRLRQVTQSAESRSSGQVSVVPTNPPPSIISQLVSEDVHNIQDTEPRNELLTLLEERTNTNSMLSTTVRELKSATLMVEPTQLESTNTPVEKENIAEDITIDTETQMKTVTSTLNTQAMHLPNTMDSVIENNEHVELDKTQWGVDGDKAMTDSSDEATREDVVASASNDLSNVGASQDIKREVTSGAKQAFMVPTYQLDVLTKHPVPGVTRERTSLSRLLENTPVTNEATTAKCKVIDHPAEKVTMSVQKLQLFPDESLSLSVQHGSDYEASLGTDEDIEIVNPDNILQSGNDGLVKSKSVNKPSAVKTKICTKDTKVGINNANISFVSPLLTEKRAKRQ